MRGIERATLAALVVLAAAACGDTTTRTAHSSIALTPALLDFGVLAPGQSKTLELTVSNDGKSPLNVGGAQVLNDTRHAFTVGDLPTQLLQARTAVVKVTCTGAGDAASDGATLVFSSDADNASAASVPLVAKTASAGCGDGVLNQDETGPDCGGTHCPGCNAGKACRVAADCAATLGCANGRCGPCAAPSACRTGEVCRSGDCSGCRGDADCPDANSCEHELCKPCPGAVGPLDTRTDPKNCGRCGVVCGLPSHASAACVVGKCGRGPCDAGYFDLDGATTFGCENSCTLNVCRAPDGTTTTLGNTPMAERSLGLHDFASGSSFGSEVETSRNHTHVGVMGESTPPPVGGAVELRSVRFRLQGGLNAMQH